MSFSSVNFPRIHFTFLSPSPPGENLLFAESRLTFFARYHDECGSGKIYIHADLGLRDGEFFGGELLWCCLQRTVNKERHRLSRKTFIFLLPAKGRATCSLSQVQDRKALRRKDTTDRTRRQRAAVRRSMWGWAMGGGGFGGESVSFLGNPQDIQ